MRTKICVLPALILGLGAIAGAGSAGAAGFQLLEQNASGLGNAYAGSAAVAENASTIFYNPAGMTQLQDREFSLGAALISPSYTFTNSASSTGALTGSGGDGGRRGVLPNAYMSWALSKDLYVGVGVGAPFGLKTQYDDAWLGAAQSRMFEIKTLNVNPSVAFRVNERVSLGFGLNWQKIDAEYIRTAGVGPIPVTGLGTVPLQLHTADLRLSDSAWGWNVGALFTLSPATKLGVSYRSSIQYKTTGTVTTTGPATVISSTFNALKTGTANADIKLPDTFISSLTHQMNDQWQLLADLSWTGWSSMPKVDIYTATPAATGLGQTLGTNFRDTWRAALGATYKLDDAWKLKFGVAYDQTPVKSADSRLVSLPDNDRTWLSAGVQWKPGKVSTLDVGAAYLFIKDSTINNDQTAQVRGLVNGSYSGNVWILGGQFSSAF